MKLPETFVRKQHYCYIYYQHGFGWRAFSGNDFKFIYFDMDSTNIIGLNSSKSRLCFMNFTNDYLKPSLKDYE